MNEHAALIYVMVMMAAADSEITDQELMTIGDILRMLPVFDDFDEELLPKLAEDCAEVLNQDDGLDAVIQLASEVLPQNLRETAYALACDVAAADGRVSQEEMRLLELIRHGLPVGRLPAAAIERGARVRFDRL